MHDKIRMYMHIFGTIHPDLLDTNNMSHFLA